MKLKKILFKRTSIMILLLLIELFWILVLVNVLAPYLGGVETGIRILGAAIIFFIMNYSTHLSADLMWIILIALMPIPGTIGYIFFSAVGEIGNRTFRGIIAETKRAEVFYKQDAKILEEAEAKAGPLAGQLQFLSHHSNYPVYENTGFEYYKLGEEGFPSMLKDLQKAERYIFLEYFIIEPGQMWDSILKILKEKAAEGVEVRVMYDDMGSINTLPTKYVETLRDWDIKGCAFNRINPVINGIMNHRDHRKILVIDGKVAYSGGINLADEYINVKVKYGKWKDNCFRVTGEAVWSYLVMFLTLWNALQHEDEDYEKYRGEPVSGESDGYIIPYGETPLSDEFTAQNVYENILDQAQNYCYIFTPYLIIDSEMTNTLTRAAKRGVDVRIIMPGVPDKKIVYAISRSYYAPLLRSGVKIYEYTPGFDHSKVFVSDDRIATVGTINLDYRSLYLHFENGTYLLDSSRVAQIRDDCLDSIAESREVRLEDMKRNLIYGLVISIIRLFAPMM